MRTTGLWVACFALATGSCSSNSDNTQHDLEITGGASDTTDQGGLEQSGGGSLAEGGTGNATGGTATNGGSSTLGGFTSATGGTGPGGSPGSGGGLTPIGGAPANGGNPPSAGTSGSLETGGTGTGGSLPAGGSFGEGGAVPDQGGATTLEGGATPTEGGAADGGATALGGSGDGGTSSTCTRAIGLCTEPEVTISNVELGIEVTGYGSERDTDPFPMAIAGMPSGGSRLAWLGTDQRVYVATLGCRDELIGSPVSFPADDLQDIIADDEGGVVMLTRNATNGGTDNCGTGTLCGGNSSPCQNTWLVRFDDSGSVVWETQVTNLSDTLAGYEDGAIFTWKQYQHHGRLAFDGNNYAAYFSAAITVYRSGTSGCVDIHEGDRMQVVSSTGELLTGHNSFPWGCSHSWTTRITWDEASGNFVMTCATDANDCAIMRPDTGALLFQASCSNQFFNGDLVNASDGGFWSAWSDLGAIHLNHFTNDDAQGAEVTDAGSSQHPHLVAYGADNMLLAWGSESGITAQVRSAGTSPTTIGSEFTIDVEDHDFASFKPNIDGSVVYAGTGESATSIKVARVMPCN